jgi:hypothetical protein
MRFTAGPLHDLFASVARSIDKRRGSTAFPTHDGPSRHGQAFVIFGGLMKIELALYQALIAINVPEEKATAVVQALETDLLNSLATKTDIAQLDIKLTLRFGAMLAASSGIMLTVIKLF